MSYLTASPMSRRRISVLAATLALGTSGALLGAGPASAATAAPAHSSSGLLGQTTTVYVPATTAPTSSDMPGVDTGIDLAPGEAAMITATGTASCTIKNLSYPCQGLDANGDGAGTIAGAANPPFMDPNAPAYSLVGEVGDGPLTFVGTGPITLEGPGELLLGYNDEIGDYSDNGGGFTVTIQTCSLYGLPILGPPLCSLLG
jgi:hypothetical protein